MKDFINRLNPIQYATLVWLGLVLATLLAALISHFIESGFVLLIASVIILIIKGQLIVDHFMALKNVSRHWRILMSAYCIVIGSLTVVAFVVGMN